MLEVHYLSYQNKLNYSINNHQNYKTLKTVLFHNKNINDFTIVLYYPLI